MNCHVLVLHCVFLATLGQCSIPCVRTLMSSAKYVAEEQVQPDSFQRHVAVQHGADHRGASIGSFFVITGPLAVSGFTADLEPSISFVFHARLSVCFSGSCARVRHNSYRRQCDTTPGAC